MKNWIFLILKDLISLTELSNVRLHNNEIKVSSIEPKVGPMMFETPSSSIPPYLFTPRIHEVWWCKLLLLICFHFIQILNIISIVVKVIIKDKFHLLGLPNRSPFCNLCNSWLLRRLVDPECFGLWNRQPGKLRWNVDSFDLKFVDTDCRCIGPS